MGSFDFGECLHRTALICGVVGCLALPSHRARADELSGFEPRAASRATERARERLRISLMTPRDRSVVGEEDGRLFVSGRALTFDARHELYDLVVLIDTSRSTAVSAGADIDGDGWVGSGREGRWIEAKSDDWGDTVLAAQIFATRALLAQLDSRTTRVGIVAFAGDDDPKTPDAIRLAPLTFDYTHLNEVLDYLLLQRPKGHTHIAEGLRVAAGEILGTGRSRRRPEATPVLLLMTDGQPTRPFLDAEKNREYTLEVGHTIAAQGIRIDPFPIGEAANEDPSALEALAEVSGGRLTPVLQPSELLATFENLKLTRLVAVQVVNRTLGQEAERVLLQGDGSFAALVPLGSGSNRVEVLARDSAGRRAVRSVTVERLPEARPPALSPRLARQHTGLLEVRLLDLLRARIEAERSRSVRDRSVEVDVEP